MVEGYVAVVVCIIDLRLEHNTSKKRSCEGINLGKVLTAGVITATYKSLNVLMAFEYCIKTNVNKKYPYILYRALPQWLPLCEPAARLQLLQVHTGHRWLHVGASSSRWMSKDTSQFHNSPLRWVNTAARGRTKVSVRVRGNSLFSNSLPLPYFGCTFYTARETSSFCPLHALVTVNNKKLWGGISF